MSEDISVGEGGRPGQTRSAYAKAVKFDEQWLETERNCALKTRGAIQ